MSIRATTVVATLQLVLSECNIDRSHLLLVHTVILGDSLAS